MDLKEYTIKVSSMGDKEIKYDGGSFIVREIVDANDKKFSIPKTKKDGSTSVAYTQSEKVSVGDTITVAVDEKEKEGKHGTYTVRTIRTIKSDEHGVPHTSQPTSQYKKDISEEHISVLIKRVDTLEARINALEGNTVEEIPERMVGEDIKEEDLPF